MVKCKKGVVTIVGDGSEIIADIGTIIYAFIKEAGDDNEERGTEVSYAVMKTVGKAVAHATEELGISDLVAKMIDSEEEDDS